MNAIRTLQVAALTVCVTLGAAAVIVWTGEPVPLQINAIDNAPVQQIVITAKRLTAAEKLALDQADAKLTAQAQAPKAPAKADKLARNES